MLISICIFPFFLFVSHTQGFPQYIYTCLKVKKRFIPMKEQPEYLGSETFQLRDYQASILTCM
jgi:hypothetical protein